jgi:hypothetical protein
MRTITLEAKGLESSHLPDISLPESQGMRVYPEQPQQETRTDGESVYGSSAQTVAYVPSATGRITIPAIQLDWWDTREQQQRSTVLPAWEVNVLPGAAGSAEALPPPDPDDGAARAVVTEVAEVTPVDEPQGVTRLQWSLLLAGLFVVMLLVYLQRRKRQNTTPVATDRQVSTGKQQLNAATTLLEQACVENNPQAAARALLQWAAARWPEDAPLNLGSLAQRLVTGEQEVRELEQVLYATGSRDWQGDLLWQVFSKGLQAVTDEAPDRQEGLSPLYPDWSAR